MKSGRYFNFRDICDRNLWDTGYLVKKLQGYGILRSRLMGPQISKGYDGYLDERGRGKAKKLANIAIYDIYR